METSKRPKIVYLLLAAMFIITAAVAMPTTNAKYTTTKNYKINIASHIKEVTVNPFVVANTTSGSSVSVSLPYDGYYLIVAKGGDGADGTKTYAGGLGTGLITRYSTEIAGGNGGTVYGIYQGTTGTTLLLCPGTAGNRSNNSTAGTGGSNSGAGKFAGGNGNKCVRDDSQYSAQTDTTAGAGGGAGSAVYIGSKTGTLLMVAGGGGAGGAWNEKWDNMGTEASSPGGNGAGINGNGGTSSVTGGTVYLGNNGSGEGSGNFHSAGKGGGIPTANAGGAGGSVAKQTGRIVFTVTLCNERYASPGANYANGGTGGLANCFGGGGGGGYLGGGGGAGTSIKVSAGGGGGGASFVSNQLSTNDSSITAYVNQAKNGSTNLPAQPTGTDGDGDGYVIVFYLGSEYTP